MKLKEEDWEHAGRKASRVPRFRGGIPEDTFITLDGISNLCMVLMLTDTWDGNAQFSFVIPGHRVYLMMPFLGVSGQQLTNPIILA